MSFVNSITADSVNLSSGSKVLPATIVTVAAHESNFGRSKLSKEAKNLFGIKATGSWNGPTYTIMTKEYIPIPGMPPNLYPSKMVAAKFRKYNSYSESIADFIRLMKTQRYAAVRTKSTPSGQFLAMQRAGYATDPNYANKLINLSKRITLPTIGKAGKNAELIGVGLAIVATGITLYSLNK